MLKEAAPRRKRVVHLNLDETSVRLLPAPRPGAIVLEARKRLRTAEPPRLSASKREERGALTQIVIIADDDEVPRALPTIILASERVLTQARGRATAGVLPEGVHLWRGGRGWVTAASMSSMIRLLATCLRPWHDTCRFILTVDTYRAHLSPSVWRTASRAGVGYAMIPASMTWLLQPCDTHAFAAYKRALSQDFQCRLLSSDAGSDRWVILISSMIASWMRVVRDASWAASFRSNGISPNPGHPSSRVLSALGWSAPPPEALAFPDLADFSCIFPRGTDVPVDAIVSVLREPEHPVAQRRRVIPARAARASSSSAPTHPDAVRLAEPSTLARSLVAPPWRPTAPPTGVAPRAPTSRHLPYGTPLELPGLRSGPLTRSSSRRALVTGVAPSSAPSRPAPRAPLPARPGLSSSSRTA